MVLSVVGSVPGEDFDDLCQIYRVKAWRALAAFDRAHVAGMTEYRFVVMCLKNLEKDLKNRVRRDLAYIEDLVSDTAVADDARRQSRDSFEGHLLSSSAEEVFQAVEDEKLRLPSTLTGLEIRVVYGLYIGWRQADLSRLLDVEKNAMTRLMRSIRLKLEDWRPTGAGLEAPAAALEIVAAA